MVYVHNAEALQKRTILEAQWSNCPDEVVEEVKKLWREEELGNDRYFYPWNHDYCNEEYPCGEDWVCEKHKYPVIAKYLEDNNIKENLWVRWWW